MKRFTDTDIWDKEWYMKLSPRYKCLIKFLFDKCDSAGIWSPNWALATTYINDDRPFTAEDLKPLTNQVEIMEDGKVFIPGFIDFQYGQLSESCKPHLKIISLLKKHNLYERIYIPYTKGIDTLQEKEEDKEEEEVVETTEGGSRGKQSRRPNIKNNHKPEAELKDRYKQVITEVQKLIDVPTQKRMLAEFITEHHPSFIEPYADLWNISTRVYGIASIEAISDGRVKKFKSRVREPDFDFLRVLQEIRNSQYLQGKKTDWKIDWDWLFENDTNYLKVIEGKYRNTTN